MYRKWSVKEVELLKKYYPIMDNRELLKLFPNRTVCAIIHKASRLGLVKEIRWWTKEEIEILKKNWPIKTKPELLQLLPKKDWTNIRHKAGDLGLKKKKHITRYWHTYKKLPDITLTDKQIGYFAGIIDGE